MICPAAMALTTNASIMGTRTAPEFVALAPITAWAKSGM